MMQHKQVDLSPDNFDCEDFVSKNILKNTVRAYLYPVLNFISTLWLSSRFKNSNFQPDFWLWGQRGNDYPRLRKRVSRHIKISESEILVAGCGSGKDLPSWLMHNPRSIYGVDLFNYEKAWQKIKDYSKKVSPSTHVEMHQGNLESLDNINDETFDLVASDAVFEHIQNMKPVLSEFYRVLRPGGILYATYGPMWFSWGGDHHSGFDNLDHGYNHLLLSEQSYQHYINVDDTIPHCENDGRTWIKESLFSFLKPHEYLEHLNNCGFKKLELGVIVDPRALRFAKKNPEVWKRLYGCYDELNLVLTGMTIIYQKPKNY